MRDTANAGSPTGDGQHCSCVSCNHYCEVMEPLCGTYLTEDKILFGLFNSRIGTQRPEQVTSERYFACYLLDFQG